MGIVHGGANNVPNILRMVSDKFPRTEVSVESFGQKHLCHVSTISDYISDVERSYQAGTHRAGTMRNISLVGCQQEERGGYFEEVLKVLESHPFLKEVLPWGSNSMYDNLDPGDSDDGPIMWCCAGEQTVPLQELPSGAGGTANNGGTPSRKRTVLDRLQLMPRNERPREKLIEDRTGAHADMAGLFPFRHPVAAAGFVQGATAGAESYELKDIVAFHGGDMDRVAETCGLYFHEEAKDQLIDSLMWIDEAKLNFLRRQGIRYSRIRLSGGDIYFIPRKVVHQFRTIGACISVTWHLKHKTYYVNGEPTETISATGDSENAAAQSASETERAKSPSAGPRPAQKLNKSAVGRRFGGSKGDKAPRSPSKRPVGRPPARRRRKSDTESEDSTSGSSSESDSASEEEAEPVKRRRVASAGKDAAVEDLGDDFLLEDSSELESSDSD
mgnify:FL=1